MISFNSNLFHIRIVINVSVLWICAQIRSVIKHCANTMNDGQKDCIRKAVVKFIDEISSVSSDLFEFIHFIDKHIREGLTAEHSLNDWMKPAHGLTVVLVGIYFIYSLWFLE